MTYCVSVGRSTLFSYIRCMYSRVLYSRWRNNKQWRCCTAFSENCTHDAKDVQSVGKVTAFRASSLSIAPATITGSHEFSQLGAYVSLASYNDTDVIIASSTAAGIGIKKLAGDGWGVGPPRNKGPLETPVKEAGDRISTLPLDPTCAHVPGF